MNTLFNKITIIIILYEEKEQLVLKCLENLKNFKIIIVDNSNNLALKKLVEKNYKIFKYVLNEKNYGYSKAANQAIKLSDTEFILMFQADGIIDQTDIFKLLDAHKKYENSFIVSPTLFDKEQNVSANSGNFPEKYFHKTPSTQGKDQKEIKGNCTRTRTHTEQRCERNGDDSIDNLSRQPQQQ